TGDYYFRTIKPVPYPGRAPHIHFMVKMKQADKFTTQCYIKGYPGNEKDQVFKEIKDMKARESLLVNFTPIPSSSIGEVGARFDIVLGYTPQG
ncbi:MAG: intradiol ring-cleavage dioxygenase, partial [Acidobacteriota bacterium]